MLRMAKHADPGKTTGTSSAKVPAWAVLITMGGTSIVLNFWDATHAAHPLFLLVAGLRGFAPVLAAMFISEAGARFDGGQVFRRVTFAIMVGAMFLSASAVANVLRPSYPAGWLGLILSWLFGIVLDAAALAGLWIILTERERRRDAERQGEADEAAQAMAEAVAAAEERAAELARQERAQIEAEAAQERAAVEAEAEQMRTAHAAELERLRTDLAAANATAEALRGKSASARKRSRTTARKPAGTATRNQPGTTAPEPALTTGPEPAMVPAGSTGPEGELDMDQEARLLILDYVAKGHSASKAGRLAGASDSYGRQVVRLANAAKKEPAGDERTEGDMSDTPPGERS